MSSSDLDVQPLLFRLGVGGDEGLSSRFRSLSLTPPCHPPVCRLGAGGDEGLSSSEQARVAGLRAELGGGEGVSSLLTTSLQAGGGGGAGVVQEPELLSPPSSPRQRYHTFGATLDFIEVRRFPLHTGCWHHLQNQG